MHIHFEEPSSQLRCDSVISSLSWMGRVPDEQPEGHGWKLNRTSYYQEGWLAAGNVKSVVGVTFTSTLPHRTAPMTAAGSSKAQSDLSDFTLPPHLPLPPRTNYNLRGHRAQISLVRWNEPYQKLATCDASGIIFVWIRYEGRWSIELINDRNTPVTHFSWSHDGRMAVIAYQDGFVLVGSVAGQRYWSTVLSQDSVITTGTWTPDDQQVYLGTSSGSIVVLDVHNGTVVAQIQMAEPSSSSTAANGIRQLAWNCPRFKMEEPTTTTTSASSSSGNATASNGRTDSPHYPLFSSLSGEDQHVLAVLTFGGRLSLIKGFDDVQPCCPLDEDEEVFDDDHPSSGCKGPLSSPMMEWNNDGELLCLAGHYASSAAAVPATVHYANVLQFYNSRGALRFRIAVPYTQAPITSLTWGHNDRRLFVATGCTVHVAWVSPRRMASLQHLARLKLRQCLSGADQLERVADRIPRLIKNLILSLFSSTVHCHVPEEQRIRQYICRPPPGNTRLYCTMIRRDDEESDGLNAATDGLIDPSIDPVSPAGSGGGGTGGVAFTLYLEFLGGLIPLLKGKPTSRIRPEFVIFDPKRHHQQQQQASNVNAESNKYRSNKSGGELLIPAPTSRLHQLLSPALQRRFRGNQRRRPAHQASSAGETDSETDDSCVSTPRLQRKSAAKRQQQQQQQQSSQHCSAGVATEIDETKSAGQENGGPLAEVTSNIWGTRFKITGLAPCLPAHLGQVTYKTSLLHLQPRQMTLGVVDLRDSTTTSSDDVDDVPTAAAAAAADTSADDEGAKIHQETSTRHHPAIVPLSTPNLRLRRKAAAAAATLRRTEPPPSPTHHRRPVQSHQMVDELLRIEWNGQSDRIVLSAPAVRWRSLSAGHLANNHKDGSVLHGRPPPHRRRKSRSLDSSPVIGMNRPFPDPRSSWAVQIRQKSSSTTTTTATAATKTNGSSFRSRVGSQLLQVQHVPPDQETSVRKDQRFALARLSPLFSRRCPLSKSGRSEPSSPSSSPANSRRRNVPANVKNERHQSPIRQLLNSPLLARRLGKSRFAAGPAATSAIDSSDDDMDDDPQATTVHHFHDLESFQKAQLLNKLRQTWIAEKNAAAAAATAGNSGESSKPLPRREFVLNNKAPLWNEHSQVYQLDFGGRVTQESAKNFQIEFKGKQVMQFGRIDGNAYTLDFQYPFSAVQAFAVALANVTQRLK